MSRHVIQNNDVARPEFSRERMLESDYWVSVLMRALF
jgi:hypothetical protein